MLPTESDGDLRSCYCAAAITYMLTKALEKEGKVAELGFDRIKLIEYVLKC